MANSDYVPGSISMFLDTASSSAKETKLQAIFSSAPTKLPGISKLRVGKVKCSRQKTSEVAYQSSEDEPSRRAKKRQLEETTLVYKREAGFREAELESTPRKKKNPAKFAGMEFDKGLVDGKKSFADCAAARIASKSKRNRQQEERTVFVGNVALAAGKKALKKLFEKCGKVETVRLRSVPVADMKLPKKASVIMKNFHPSRQSANAYIVFSSPESVQKALSLNGAELQGLHIRVDSSTSSRKHDHKHSVFIGNLSFDAEEEDVRKHFGICGKVTAVRIVRDKVTGAGKGFGYVTFTDSSSVTLALSLNNQPLNGRPLRIERSTSKQKPGKKHQDGTSSRQFNKNAAANVITEATAAKKKDKKRKGSDLIPNETSAKTTNRTKGQSSPLPLTEQPKKQLIHKKFKECREEMTPEKEGPAEKAISRTDRLKKHWNHKKLKEQNKKKLRKKGLQKKKESLGQLLMK